MKKLLSYIIIVLILAISIFLLLKIPRPIRATVKNNSNQAAGSFEEWLGVFIQGQRIGYSFTKITKVDSHLEIENNQRMTINMMNTQTTLNSHLFAHTDTQYALEDFVIEIKTEGHEMRIEGIVKGLRLDLTSYSHGIPQQRSIQLSQIPYLPDAVEEIIRKKKLKPGSSITIPYFDPITQSTSSARIKVGNKEKISVLNKEAEGLRVDINYMGIDAILWIDDDYRLIKETTPAMAMEMIPLTKEQALAQIEPANAFDLLSFFAVKIDKPLPDPVSLRTLTVELHNIDFRGLDISDDYQKLVKNDPLTIEFFLPVLDSLPDMKIPMSEFKEYLEPTLYVQSNDMQIINEAHRIIGSETSARRAVALLTEEVYKMIKKNPVASVPSAIDVLRTREGDCNEHAILFTALARAIGIPTKIYVGLVNLDGSSYFYHAWCAVWLGKWVPVDPTFNRFPADIGHLKFKEGELSEWAQVMKVVGKLRIKILHYTAL